MSILERYGTDPDGERRDYYGWHTENAGGFHVLVRKDREKDSLSVQVLGSIG